MLLPGFLESHEQDGRHPLLLSDDSQAKLGFVKDMRENIVNLKDYDDYLEIHRAKGSGLKVVCISHFPKNCVPPEMFVPDQRENARKNQAIAEAREKARSLSPHKTLVAHPATAPDSQCEQLKPEGNITLVSFGLCSGQAA